MSKDVEKTWDIKKIPDTNGPDIVQALKEGYEPFSVVIVPVQESALSPQAVLIPFIYFKRAVPVSSTTKLEVVR